MSEQRNLPVGEAFPPGAGQRLARPLSLLTVAVTVVMLLAAGAGVWRGIYAAASIDGPDGQIPLPDPARTRPASIESSLDAATNRATSWDPDVRLFSVTAQFDYPTNPGDVFGTPVGGWLIFVFVRGEGDDTDALTLLVERNRAQIVRETARPLGVRASGLDPAEIQGAAVDSAQALTIAEAEAGQSFRTACLRSRHVARLTYRPADGTVASAWVISYNDARVANGPVVRVVVDAQTGQAAVSRLEATIPESVDLDTCPD